MICLKKVTLVASISIALIGCDSSDDATGGVPDGDTSVLAFNIGDARTLLTSSESTYSVMAGKQSYNGSSDSNLIKIREDGEPELAIESPYNPQFSFTVASPDGKYLYAVIDDHDNWKGDNWTIIERTNCAIFKVQVSDSSWTCADSGMIVRRVSQQKDLERTTGRPAKSLQVNNDGHVVYYGDVINGDWSTSSLRRIEAGSNKSTPITSDAQHMESFVLLNGNSLIHKSSQSLFLVSNIDRSNPDTVRLNENMYSVGNYNVDDNETAFFTDTSNGNPRVIAAQPSKIYPGGHDNREIRSNLQHNQHHNSNIIVGDDGHLYFGNYSTVYEILPYVEAPIYQGEQKSDEWYRDHKFQVERGYLYTTDAETHNAYGERDNIVMLHLGSNEETRILNGDWLEQRIKIHDWRVGSDMLFFTGFNQSGSKMVWGEVNTRLMREGAPESEYLMIRESVSNTGDSKEISDMELLGRPTAPENEGGNPRIIEFKTHSSNIYNSTVEFNKWMNYESVYTNSRVLDLENGVAVDGMYIWLGKNLHIAYDLNPSDGGTATPLEWDRTYRLEFDGNTLDNDGFPLNSTNAPREHEFTTREACGWFSAVENNNIEGITDGQVAKFSKECENTSTFNIAQNLPTKPYVFEWSSRDLDTYQKMAINIVGDGDESNILHLLVEGDKVCLAEKAYSTHMHCSSSYGNLDYQDRIDRDWNTHSESWVKHELEFTPEEGRMRIHYSLAGHEGAPLIELTGFMENFLPSELDIDFVAVDSTDSYYGRNYLAIDRVILTNSDSGDVIFREDFDEDDFPEMN